MKVPVSALLALVSVFAITGAAAETLDCRAQLKRQDEQCQMLGEKLEAACPGGQNIKDNAECRQISSQIANTCTRKPCAPVRKARSKGKGKKGKGMGKAAPKAKPAETSPQ